MVVDWSVMYWLASFGAGEAYQFSFGALVAFWLTMNELISIVNNIHQADLEGYIMTGKSSVSDF